MALSGSFDWTINAGEVFAEVLENLGVVPVGDSIDSQHVTSLIRAFNIQLKSLQAQGLALWTWRDADLTLVDGQNAYLLGPTGDTCVETGTATQIQRPLEIKEARFVNSDGTERQCNVIPMSEYNLCPVKDSEGEVVNVAYEPLLTNAKLHVWPTPSAAGTLRFSYKKPVDDIDGVEDNINAPVDCYDAIVIDLTARVAARFGVQLAERQYWDAKAKDALASIHDFEDDTAISFAPERTTPLSASHRRGGRC